MELNCVEKDVSARPGQRHLIIGRAAHITARMKTEHNASFETVCWEGCPLVVISAHNLLRLPAAMKTGKLSVRPWSIVTKSALRQRHKGEHG